MRIAVVATLLFAFLVNAPSASAQMSFGARTQIWYFMWKDGGALQSSSDTAERMKSRVSELNLDKYAELGATWNIVDVWQQIDGPDGFRRLARVIEEHERRGIQVALRLLEDPEIYAQLSKSNDSATILSEYEKWVSAVAKRFGKRVRYYLVSNEVDHDVGYNVPIYKKSYVVRYDDYEKVLAAAYRAIKAVDKGLLVLDHGTSSYSLCLAVASAYAETGRVDQAIAFLRGMRNGGTSGWADSAKAVYALRRPENARRIEFAKATMRRAGRYSDVLQFHHYFGPDVLPQVIQWIRGEMVASGGERPIVTTELGYRILSKKGQAWNGRAANIADVGQYSETEHAADIVKNITILGAMGARDVLYWQIRFHNNRSPTMTLYASTEKAESFAPFKAAKAWAFAARQFSDAQEIMRVNHPDNNSLVEYRAAGSKKFSVLWAANGSMPLPKDWSPRIKRVLDIEGRDITSNIREGWTIGEAPLHVEWLSEKITQDGRR